MAIFLCFIVATVSESKLKNETTLEKKCETCTNNIRLFLTTCPNFKVIFAEMQKSRQVHLLHLSAFVFAIILPVSEQLFPLALQPDTEMHMPSSHDWQR